LDRNHRVHRQGRVGRRRNSASLLRGSRTQRQEGAVIDFDIGMRNLDLAGVAARGGGMTRQRIQVRMHASSRSDQGQGDSAPLRPRTASRSRGQGSRSLPKRKSCVRRNAYAEGFDLTSFADSPEEESEKGATWRCISRIGASRRGRDEPRRLFGCGLSDRISVSSPAKTQRAEKG